MNMRTQYFFSFLLSFVFFLISCSKDEVTENENTLEESEIPEEFKDSYLDTTIQVDGVNAAEFYKGCYVNSVLDETPISSGAMKLQSNINKKVQTYFLTDGGDKIYQMTRVSDTKKNKKIEFTAKNTALAFISLHPLFAHVDSTAYDILEETILQSSSFSKVQSEVNKIIKQKIDLINPNNTVLFDAFESLLDELIGNYKLETTSRALTNETMYHPFWLNSSGNRLELQMYGLYPNYYGTATHDGIITDLAVESLDDDIGILRYIGANLGNSNSYLGPIERYYFSKEGECQFYFTCNNTNSRKDLANKVLNSVNDFAGGMLSSETIESLVNTFMDKPSLENVLQLSINFRKDIKMPFFPILQLYDFAPSSENDYVELIKELSDISSKLVKEGIDCIFEADIKRLEELIEKTTVHEKANKFYSRQKKYVEMAQKTFKQLMIIYSASKMIVNATGRLMYQKQAPNPFEFKLIYYNDEIRNWSKIDQYKGDNQTGILGVELDEHISVMVNIDRLPTSDYIVKFEVTKGGGSVGNSEKTEEYVEISDNVASINWTLGSDSEEQIVRASLCEKSSKEEVCESVEFKATAEQELLSIYIENIEYEESPSHDKGIVTFEPTITVSTDETEKLENLYDWGLVIYKEDNSGMQQEIERIKVGKNFDSIDFTRKFELEKSDMDIDCTNFVAKNDNRYSIGTYVKYDINGRTFDSDVLVPIELVYNRKPEIKFTNIKLTRNSGYDNTNGFYYRDVIGCQCYLNGTLFFKGTVLSYGRSTNPQIFGHINGPGKNTLGDMSDENSHNIDYVWYHTYWKFSRLGEEIYVEAIMVNEQIIRSTNYIIETNSFPCSYYIE